MSVPVLIGFAGVLVAAVATGLLAGRCVRQPRIGVILWTAATLGLTIALAAVVVAVATASLAVVRASRDSGPALDSGPTLTAVVPAALAVLMTAGQRFPLPAKVAYPLLSMAAAALVWFAVSRVGEPPRRQ